jgi:hypothetical protein
MAWRVKLHSAFEAEFGAFEQVVKEQLAAVAELLVDYGRSLGDLMQIRSKARNTRT